MSCRMCMWGNREDTRSALRHTRRVLSCIAVIMQRYDPAQHRRQHLHPFLAKGWGSIQLTEVWENEKEELCCLLAGLSHPRRGKGSTLRALRLILFSQNPLITRNLPVLRRTTLEPGASQPEIPLHWVLDLRD